MNFQSLKTKRCPFCGAEAVQEGYETTAFDGKPNVHCNGQRWESRRFACGYGVQWSPNFGRETELGECKNDPAVVEQKQRYEVLILSLRKVIEESDVSERIKNNLLWKLS